MKWRAFSDNKGPVVIHVVSFFKEEENIKGNEENVEAVTTKGFKQFYPF